MPMGPTATAASAEPTSHPATGPTATTADTTTADLPTPGRIRVRPLRASDAEEVLAIYQAGLDGGQASFEATAPSRAAFDAARSPELRFVATDTVTEQVLGWVAASRVSDRCVDAGVVEHSVYVHPTARGRGIGTALLETLITATEKAGVWTIQSGIFPENLASLALHRLCGFEVVGVRRRLGRHHGRWRDVVFIERRSPVIN